MIKDEFSDLKVSRQRKWALRQQKLGRCIICGEEAESGVYCGLHLIEQRERLRKPAPSLTGYKNNVKILIRKGPQDSRDLAFQIVRALNEAVSRSRFYFTKAISIGKPKVPTRRYDYVWEIKFVACVRLKEKKDSCGQHSGPCVAVFAKPHRHYAFLEGADWVSFFDLLNDVLDGLNVKADIEAGSFEFGSLFHRLGRYRRVAYRCVDWGERTCRWIKFGSLLDYENYCGKKAPRSAFPDSTPGIPLATTHPYVLDEVQVPGEAIPYSRAIPVGMAEVG